MPKVAEDDFDSFAQSRTAPAGAAEEVRR